MTEETNDEDDDPYFLKDSQYNHLEDTFRHKVELAKLIREHDAVHYNDFKAGHKVFNAVRDLKCLYMPTKRHKLEWRGENYNDEMACDPTMTVRKQNVISSFMSQVKKDLTQIWEAEANAWLASVQKHCLNSVRIYELEEDKKLTAVVIFKHTKEFLQYFHLSHMSQEFDGVAYVFKMRVFEWWISDTCYTSLANDVHLTPGEDDNNNNVINMIY